MSELISVVMPVHNGGEFLQAAVDSILLQTHQSLELIIVDDHSDDMAVANLNVSDPRVQIITAGGRGVAKAFNQGFAKCRGDYIARMDADDIALVERLQAQLEYFRQNPAVDIISCCVEFFSADGIMGGLLRYQNWLNSVCTAQQIHQQMFIESPMPNPGAMFRLAALKRLKGYREMPWAEDYDLFLRADAAGMQMGKPDQVLLRWREHGQRLTHTDPVYSRDQFMRAKAHFLVNHRFPEQAFILWGAGPSGRLMHDLITAQGGQVTGFIEVHPRRVGGQKRDLPVWPIEKAAESGIPVILVAVGTAGARKKIADFMSLHKKAEGSDYVFVA
jgi:glycosyltransferase involved in cell wall biosynthesis